MKNKKQRMKRLLSALLCLAMVLSLMPTAVLAAEGAPVCDCGTDDGLIHATTCAVYVAPENPVCKCAMKCTEPNEWCDVCGFDVTGCTGTDTAVQYDGGAIDLSTLTETYLISDSGEYTFEGSGNYGIKVESGNPTIVLNNASIMVGEGSAIDIASGSTTAIQVLGDNTISTSKTESSDAPCGGIFVAEGGTVNITSNGTDNILRAHGTLAAAIGGKYDYDNDESYNAGNINISNVTVYAYTNNYYAAAIGAAGEGTCGTINITNAVVYAYGAGDQWTSAPGIGSAWSLMRWPETIPVVIISDSEIHTFRYNSYSDYIGHLGDESGDTYATGSINCGDGGSVKNSTIYCYTGLDATTTDKTVKYGALGGLLKEDGTCEGEHSGGTATCTTQAVCDLCGESYGELAEHSVDSATGKCSVCQTQFAVRVDTWTVMPDSTGLYLRVDITKYYTTLADAAADAYIESGSTLTVLTDASVPAEATYVFSDITVAVNPGATLTVDGHLTLTGSSTLTNHGNWAGEGFVTVGEQEYKVFDKTLYYYGGEISVLDESQPAFVDCAYVPGITYWKADEGYLIFTPASAESVAVLELHNAVFTVTMGSVEVGAISHNHSMEIHFYGENRLTVADSDNYGAVLEMSGTATMIAMEENATLNISTCGRFGIDVDALEVESGTVSIRSGNNSENCAVRGAEKITVSSGAVLNLAFGEADEYGVAYGAGAREIIVEEGGTLNGLTVEPSLSNTTFVYLVHGNTVLDCNLDLTVFAVLTDGDGSFAVPTGTSLTVAQGKTLDLSAMKLESIDFSGKIINYGTIKLPEGFSMDNAPKGGTVTVGDKSYTWDGDNGKWICGENSHIGGEATCTAQAICDVCGEGYGELKRHESELDDSDCTTPVRCSVCGAVTKEANVTHTWGEDNFCSNENCQQTKVFTFTFTYGDEVLFVRNVHTGNSYTFEGFEERDGLTLVGWDENDDGEVDYAIDDYIYVEGDLSFEAVYKLVYTIHFITYDIWEGAYSESFNPIMGEANQTVTLWDNASPYFKFLGWAMEEGGEVIYEANEEITLTQNLTLYGVIRPYRATFELGEGTVWNDENGDPITALEGDYSGSWIEIRKFPTRTGYIFQGFVDQTEMLWEPYEDEDTGEWILEFYFDRADLEMTAVWEECTEHVYDDANDAHCNICGAKNPNALAITGNYKTFGDASDAITIQLVPAGKTEPAYVFSNADTLANSGAWRIDAVAKGTYTVKVIKQNHVTREYAITVGNDALKLDVEIWLLGDVTGDGSVNFSDYAKVLSQAKNPSAGTLEGYALACGDVTVDGHINFSDYAKVLSQAKGMHSLW